MYKHTLDATQCYVWAIELKRLRCIRGGREKCVSRSHDLHIRSAKRAKNTEAAPTEPSFRLDGWRHCCMSMQPEACKRTVCQTGPKNLVLSCCASWSSRSLDDKSLDPIVNRRYNFSAFGSDMIWRNCDGLCGFTKFEVEFKHINYICGPWLYLTIRLFCFCHNHKSRPRVTVTQYFQGTIQYTAGSSPYER